MNLNKHYEFFDPDVHLKNTSIHIIGCGAIGSTVAEMLARLGIQNIHLYDFDTVSPHNLTNQMFLERHIGQAKTETLKDILTDINPALTGTIKLHKEGWKPEMNLRGIVILAVDNIDLRRQIVKENQYNPNINLIMDFRMGLTDAQHYAADWDIPAAKENLLNSMDFSHDEAKANMPVSACGTTLNITPTVRTIVSLGTANMINFLKEPKSLKKLILVDAFTFDVTAM